MKTKTITDARASGLTSAAVDPLRYNGDMTTPWEAGGKVYSLVPPQSRVLDVGCGEGALAEILKCELGAEVVVIEPHPTRAERARARGLEVHATELDSEVLAKLGKFDVILFVDVLEHLVDPSAMLRLAATGLKDGGAVIASVPNVAHWTVRANLLRGRFQYAPIGIMDATHLRWFTRDTIRELFESSGLRVTHLDATAGAWMSEYAECWPWRWMSEAGRERIVRWCSERWPGVFGCQHIVRAELRRSMESGVKQ